jgi:uncharacterized protein YjbI with pentapeptide repeats
MHERIEVRGKDVSGSHFEESDMSSTTFSDVNLEKATFENINLRRATFSAVDFGGAKFECVNTGEDRHKVPATFEGVEFDHSTFHECVFTGVNLTACKLKDMTIDGICVTEMIKVYRKTKDDKGISLLSRVLGKGP